MSEKRFSGNKQIICECGNTHWYNERELNTETEEWQSAWICGNCNRIDFIKPRAKKSWDEKYDYATKTATTDAKLNIEDTKRFHCFNPNGLIAEHTNMMSRTLDLVKAGTVKSGWLLVADTIYISMLLDLLNKKQVPRIELNVVLKLLKEHTDNCNARIDEL